MAILDESNHYVNPETVSILPTGNRWGLILGAAGVIMGLLFFLFGIIDYTGTKSNLFPNLIQWGVTAGVFYMAIKAHRDEDLGGLISLGRCVKLGAYMGLIGGVLTAIYMFVHIKYLQPDFANIAIEAAVNSAEAKGQDPDKVRDSLEMMRGLFSPTYMMAIGFFGSMISSLFVALIVGFFMRKER
ncbi:MAG: hypothetical protein RIS64_2286 [Bacteroidota bacterium]|jgi:vacuolar-type H+-ATPase subunit I/STV1